MGLPWVRIDSNIANHPKIMRLVRKEKRYGYQAAFAYVCAICWSGGHTTDGFIPDYSLDAIYADERVARLLVDYRLWEYAEQEGEKGYQIKNWVMRQQLEIVSASNLLAKKIGGIKGACVKHHGPKCECWKKSVAELSEAVG